MTDVKRLLDEATPLPWAYRLMKLPAPKRQWCVVRADDHDGKTYLTFMSEDSVGAEQDAALIVYAVNRLPDYEAAVDALERLVEISQMYRFSDVTEVSAETLRAAEQDARAALRRLRGNS